MTNKIDEIHKTQRAVFDAFGQRVEVETRERGWNSKDMGEARDNYEAAVNLYRSKYGMEPEYGEREELFTFPLKQATTTRVMIICGSKEG
ncbi:hypothetical protein [uncultured Paraglaciecola sp.]|uniref:hypothetical protein n=1 Tax=uncultured Paraglaciecola sp. TaxID=1765024 RepID=UPI00262EB081|nr:hypothetical protein [uncultured Paraglaciecola sp.]